jgi:hypothetical protein
MAHVSLPVTEGDKVVVRFGRGETWRCIVRVSPHPNRARESVFRVTPAECTPADEGIIWARGWDGPAADALRALVALTS